MAIDHVKGLSSRDILSKPNTQANQSVRHTNLPSVTIYDVVASKYEYDAASGKGSDFCLDFQDTQNSKFEKNSVVSLLNARRASQYAQLTAPQNYKSSRSTMKYSMQNLSAIYNSAISDFSSKISSCKSIVSQLHASISVGSSIVSSNQSATVAIDTSQTIAQGTGTAGVIAEAQNSSNIETELSTEPASNASEVEKQIEEFQKKIKTLETQLNDISSKQAYVDFNANYEQEIESSYDESLNTQFKEIEELDKQISNEQSSIPGLEVKMELKRKNISNINSLIGLKEDGYEQTYSKYENFLKMTLSQKQDKVMEKLA